MVRVGISGWSYPEWTEGLYRGIPGRLWLERYAEVFSTVEVNYTFRRRLGPETVESWRRRTPAGFRFALKANLGITHQHDRERASRRLGEFTEAARRLEERLGPVLFQIPEFRVRDDAYLGWLLEALPDSVRAAVEFLHPSWDAPPVLSKLAEAGATRVLVEIDEPLDLGPVGAFLYLRLRKESYSGADLQEWASRLRLLQATSWVYLRHGPDAPARAAALQESL